MARSHVFSVGLACLLLSSQALADDEYSRQELFILGRILDPPAMKYSLPPNFKFPQDAKSTSTFGVDVSHHVEDSCHCAIEWQGLPLRNIKFAYIKATQGTDYTDPRFGQHYSDGRKAQLAGSLHVGPYHFFTAQGDPLQQAAHFIHVVGPVDARDLPPSLDLEWDLGSWKQSCPDDATIQIPLDDGTVRKRCDLWSGVPYSQIIRRVNIWLEAVRAATGREPIVYTNKVWWMARIGLASRLNELHTHLLWVANYSKGGLATERLDFPPGQAWSLWQFTDRAVVPLQAHQLSLDANIYHGSLPALLLDLGSKN